MSRAYACPFFERVAEGQVMCEGCVLLFAGDTKKEYIERYCCAVPGWEDCSIAQELIKQEERNEEEAEKAGKRR